VFPARVVSWVFVGALACYLLTAGGSLSSTDSVVAFELTKSIVERGALDIPERMVGSGARLGIDGRYYSQFGLGQSLFNVPFYVAGRAAGQLIGPDRLGTADTVPKAVVALASAVAAAIAVVAIFALALELTGHLRAALFAAASVAVASPLWPYSKFGFATALTAAVLACAGWCCCRAASTTSVRWSVCGGWLIAFGWLIRHEMALFLLPYAAFLWSSLRPAGRRRQRTIVGAFLAVGAIGGIVWATYNVVRFGDPLQSGFTPAWSTTGYLALIASPAGSVLLFCPIVLLWLWGLRAVASIRLPAIVLLLGPAIVAYAFYGALADWPGGRSYGPRYLTPSLVMMAPALAFALRAGVVSWRTAQISIGLAALLQLPGVLVDYSKVSVAWARTATVTEVQERYWRPAASPWVLNTAEAWTAVPRNMAYLVGAATPPPVEPKSDQSDRDFSQRFAFSLDFWWLYLFYAGVISKAAALAVAGVLAAVSVLAWSKAFRLAGRR